MHRRADSSLYHINSTICLVSTGVAIAGPLELATSSDPRARLQFPPRMLRFRGSPPPRISPTKGFCFWVGAQSVPKNPPNIQMISKCICQMPKNQPPNIQIQEIYPDILAYPYFSPHSIGGCATPSPLLSLFSPLVVLVARRHALRALACSQRSFGGS